MMCAPQYKLSLIPISDVNIFAKTGCIEVSSSCTVCTTHYNTFQWDGRRIEDSGLDVRFKEK